MTQQISLFDLENNSTVKRTVNVSAIPQRSPFRYPGGKTWFVPHLRNWLKTTKRPTLLVEPFTGGGIVGLTAAFENLVDNVLFIEKDPLVSSVWRTILGGNAEWLAHRILTFELTVENCQAILNGNQNDDKEEAFRTILRNRINHGGIIAAGSGMLKKGEAGKGISSRWYPQTLANRIRAIHQLRAKFSFHEGDGIEIINQHSLDDLTYYFIDPPYTAGTKGKRAGKRLYTHHQLDHNGLFDAVSKVKGKFLITYDDDPEVVAMAQERGLKIDKIYMRGTHHKEITELVISNNS